MEQTVGRGRWIRQLTASNRNWAFIHMSSRTRGSYTNAVTRVCTGLEALSSICVETNALCNSELLSNVLPSLCTGWEPLPSLYRHNASCNTELLSNALRMKPLFTHGEDYVNCYTIWFSLVGSTCFRLVGFTSSLVSWFSLVGAS